MYTETLPIIYCEFSPSDLRPRVEIIPKLLRSETFINVFRYKSFASALPADKCIQLLLKVRSRELSKCVDRGVGGGCCQGN